MEIWRTLALLILHFCKHIPYRTAWTKLLLRNQEKVWKHDLKIGKDKVSEKGTRRKLTKE